MALHRLAHIELGMPADRIAASRAFYRDLGLTETTEGNFATDEGGEQLRLVSAPFRTLTSITVGVDNEDDLGRVAASLKAIGIEATCSAQAIHAVEPATKMKVTLEVQPRLVQKAIAPLPTNGPGRQVRKDRRSEVVMNLEQPRPHRLSHAVTLSADVETTRRFFVQGIGFQISDEIPEFGASFMRCSTDHHNLLIQGGPVTSLHHVAWEMADLDAVGRVAGALVAADPSRHVWGIGRHAIGSNYFWYLRDPAGNFVECTSDLDVIADAEAWKVASSGGADGLAVWGPPVPMEFLMPTDIAERIQAG